MITPLFTITGIIGITYILIILGEKIKIPNIAILIGIGLLINIPYIENFVTQNNISNITNILGDIGLICLMLIAGFGSSIQKMKKEKKPALIISILGLIIPFLLGFVLLTLFGYDINIAIIVGIAMSITAEATTAKVLFDNKKVKSKIGTTMLEAGIIDDIIGLTVFVLIGLFLKEIQIQHYMIIAGSIIAFFIGAIAKKYVGRHFIHIRTIEKLLNIIIIPFLFINIGIHLNFGSLSINMRLMISIIITAFCGKFLGTILAKTFTSFSRKQIFLIGRAMNSRGAIELAIILMVLKIGALPIELYSTLVITALITTTIFPFAFSYIYKRNPGIMDQ